VIPIVLDTNVLVGALLSKGGAARDVLRCCLSKHYEPLIGSALFCEYEDVFARDELWAKALDGFLSVCRWVEVFFSWRPNLPDEGDNHIMELAVAGNAVAIVTRNIRDITHGELRFPSVRVVTPKDCLEIFPCLP
jgi:predicted nucleic acid-binding protein